MRFTDIFAPKKAEETDDDHPEGGSKAGATEPNPTTDDSSDDAVTDVTSADVAATFGEPPSNAVLTDMAQETVAAYDAAATATGSYRVERDRMIAEVDKALETLKRASEEAETALAEKKARLCAAMNVAKVDEVEVQGRGAVKLRTTPGRKKNVTQTWLKEALGKAKALEIWKKVPSYPPKRELVIPDPFEDEPDA